MSLFSDIASAFQRAAEISQQLRGSEPLPASEAEQQADFALSGMRRVVNDLVLADVSIGILESALLYQWLRFTTWSNKLGEDFFEYWSNRMDVVIERLVPFLKRLASELPTDDPTPQMKELGQSLDQVRRAYPPTLAEPRLTRPELEQHADKTDCALFQFVRDACDAGVCVGILESVFLYYWLRTSTLRDPTASEDFFQKFERHWQIVMARISEFAKGLGQIAPENKEKLQPTLIVNGTFMRDFLAADPPCFALGMVEEGTRRCGFVTLRLDEAIPRHVLDGGFDFGHCLLGDATYEIMQFIFDFSGFATYHALVNPNNPLAQAVLTAMVETGDYFFFALDSNRSTTAFRSDLGEGNLTALTSYLPRIRHSQTMEAQYQRAVASFTKNPEPAGTLLRWVCHDDAGYLDLTEDRLELTPA